MKKAPKVYLKIKLREKLGNILKNGDKFCKLINFSKLIRESWGKFSTATCGNFSFQKWNRKALFFLLLAVIWLKQFIC